MRGAGTRRDHDRFCQVEGWEQVRNARGKKVSHHLTYELSLPDGQILRTRISRPADATTYGPSLWKHILTDQLHVTEGIFWACVSTGELPARAGSPVGVPAHALPASLVHQLLHEARLSEGEVAHLTLAEATAIMVERWSTPG